MFERFSDTARKSVSYAQEAAQGLLHNYIGTEHLLLGLLDERNRDTTAGIVLRDLGVSHQDTREQVATILGEGEQAPEGQTFTPRLQKVLVRSESAAEQLGHTSIDTGHLLLGLIREGDSVAVQVLTRTCSDLDKLRDRVAAELPDPVTVDRPSSDDPINARLDHITTTLRTIAQQLDALQRRLDER